MRPRCERRGVSFGAVRAVLRGALFPSGLCGCLLPACVSASPRFAPDVQRAVNRDDMRRLETDELVLYYADGTRPRALDIAARLEYCRRELARRAYVHGGPAGDKPLFVLPRMPLNNAYVAASSGGFEQIAVLPTYYTTDYFLALGIPPDPANIGCHEMVHDQAFRQVSGFAGLLRAIFGEVYSPQAGLDSWWQEGLAVYYETRLQGSGRLWTKYFDGWFAAGVQDVSSLHGGWLNVEKRGVVAGGNYLFGSHFIDYLARTYGEAALWRVIEGQSTSILFPFAISNEFRRAYGKSLSALLEEFEADFRRRYPARARPPGERMLGWLGQSVNYVRGPGGIQMYLTQGVDDPPRLVILGPDGVERSSRRLTDIGVGRRMISPRVDLTSGLSLTADGKRGYFVAVDQGPLFSESRLLQLDLERDELTVVKDDLGGAGGSISSDGSVYFYCRPLDGDAGATALFRFDLARGTSQQLTSPAPRHHHMNPMISPSGARLLVTEASDAGIRLAVYDAASGQRLADVPAPPGQAFQGSWVDDGRVVYTGTDAARMQIFEADLTTHGYRRLTDAPYLPARPFSDGKTLRFLSREGWGWALDEVEHSPPAPAAAPPPAEAAPESRAPLTAADAAVAAPATAVGTSAPRPASTFAYSRYRGIDEQPPHVLSDEPYSAFDGLFVPQAWSPWFSLREENYWAIGLSATGGDHLGKQRWALAGAWDFRADRPSASLSYVNAMAAPLMVQLDAAYIARREDTLDDFATSPEVPVDIQEIIGSLVVGGRWYDSFELAVGGRYSDARYELVDTGEALEKLRFAGPLLTLAFDSAEQTPYAGRRLGFSVDATGTYFPEALSSVDYDLVDVLGRLQLTLPLPISKRHTLNLAGRMRALLGAPPGANLLQVGGSGTDVLPVLPDGSPTEDGGAGLLPPGLRFFEELRGFEDLTLFGRRALIGEATYTYPIIIDWGTASTLKILPAIFLRQLNLDLFFSAASFLEDGRDPAMAAGAALRLGFNFWVAPLSLQAQVARRLTYDEDVAFYFTLQVE